MKLVAALLVLSLGCNERDHASAAASAAAPASEVIRPDKTLGGSIVPQAHEFPPGRADDIRRLFERNVVSYPVSVVSEQGVQTQFVNPKPVFVGDHQFVVGLPPEQHVALDQMIAKLDKSAVRSSTYELTFWAVEAVPAAKSEVASDLAEVAPMLEKLAGIGARKYRSLDRVGVRSIDGTSAKVDGRLLRVKQELQTIPKGIELELDLHLNTEVGLSVEAKLQVPLDQPIVVGDSTQAATGDGPSNLLLYVVRARRVD